jgi:uncharacterized protein YndB with AHSA1/START domain
MESNQTTDTVRESVTVAADQERAFYAFSQQMTSWWPREFTHSGSLLGHIVLEPTTGSTWFEKDQTGQERPPLGRVENWNPPNSLSLTWMFAGEGSSAASGTPVSIRFLPEGEGMTRVEVEHSGLGQSAEQRTRMSSDQGWRHILESLREYVDQQNRTSLGAGDPEAPGRLA